MVENIYIYIYKKKNKSTHLLDEKFKKKKQNMIKLPS